MKKTIMTLAALVLTFTAFAGPVGKQQAMNTAKAFMKEVNANAVLQTTNVRHAPGLNGASDAQPYYVFNAENNQGFVIVSGDDRSEEILGYSDTGCFDEDNLPEPLVGMLQFFVEDLKELDKLGITEPSEINRNKAARKAVAVGRKSIAPLTTSKWSQRAPYNKYSNYKDENGYTVYAPVGCVATAVAQIIYYHKYAKIPESGIKGYTMSGGDWPGTVREDLPYREFNFSIMTNTYSSSTSSYNTTAGEEVAQLLRYIDVSGKATQYADGTYIYPEGVPSWFRTNFGYLATSIHRSTPGGAEFENYIYNDLSQGLPVWTAGYADPERHSFVIDGYSYDDFFHINWGWSGSCDGYYRLAPLNAYNYSTGHSWGKHYFAMIGARPNNGKYDNYTSYVPAILASTDLKEMYFTADDGTQVIENQTATSSFTLPLTTVLENRTNTLGSSYSRDFEIEMTLFDANMQQVGHVKPDVETVNIVHGKTANVTYTFGSKLHQMNLADGEYKLVPRSRVSGYNNYFFDRARRDYAYVKVVKNGNSITLSLVPTYTIDSYEIVGRLVAGNRAVLRIKFTNNSFSKLANTLVLYKGSVASSNPVDVQQLRMEPQSTGDIDIAFLVGTSSTKFILRDRDRVAYNTSSDTDTGVDILTTTVKPVSSTQDLDFNWYAENCVGSTIYGNEFHGYVEIINNDKNNEYQDFFTIRTSSSNVGIVKAVKIPANGSVRISLDDLAYADNIFSALNNGITSGFTIRLFDGSFARENGTTGSDNVPIVTKTWSVSSKAFFWWDKNGKLTATISLPTVNENKKTYYVVPEDAVAISFMGKDPGNYYVKPNSNENTVYYFSNNTYAERLTDYETHNVVVGSTSGTKTASKAVVFNDDDDAYVPYGFTASKGVSYTRTFDYGYEKNGGKGWTTICLPFTVETVKNGTTEIDWYHSYQDKNKLFWVNRFYGEDYLTSIYSYTDVIAANTPYLIEMPGDSWGEQWSLINKPITFSAGNGTEVKGGYKISEGLAIVDADNQNFVSAAMAYRDMQKGKSVYSIENPGNNFVYVPTPNLKSFRGYITKETAASQVVPQAVAVISFGDNEFEGGETDGIRSIDNSQFTIDNNVVYDLQGRVVSSTGLKALPKGMYIMNGKKFVIK